MVVSQGINDYITDIRAEGMRFVAGRLPLDEGEERISIVCCYVAGATENIVIAVGVGGIDGRLVSDPAPARVAVVENIVSQCIETHTTGDLHRPTSIRCLIDGIVAD